MTTNNFFKIKKGINLSSYETLPTMYSGDVSFKDCVPHYADSSNNKTPILGVMPVTVVNDHSGGSYTYSVKVYDYIIIDKSTTSAVYIQLPNPANLPLGKVFIVKKSGLSSIYITGAVFESKDVGRISISLTSENDDMVASMTFVVGEDKSDSNKRIYEII